jgi:hypothetical protein
METRMAYCSACDRDVQILVTDTAEHDAQAPIPDAEVVCLEIGVRCTGGMCPVGAVSAAAMKSRRIRAGVNTATLPIVEATCLSCDRVTSHYLLDANYAMCAECGDTIETRMLVLALGRDG